MDKIEKLYEDFGKIVDHGKDLGDELEAENDHGVGFETKENRDDFIEYFDKKVTKLMNGYMNFKNKLNSVQD